MKLKQLFIMMFMVFSLGMYSQGGIVTGKIIDSGLSTPLSGTNVVETGTTNGVISDFDGNFTLNVSKNNGSVSISYLGYSSKVIKYTLVGGKANLGNVPLSEDANSLNEVVIIGSGVIDLAEGRKTPVAVSNITAKEIQNKVAGNTEFIEALKNTPSVYVSNQSGGFGDSQMFLRGFDQTNTAFLLNGQPINGMEDGKMYWSNWSGMSDVSNGVQIQRGLGSSKLAISSVGGTVNIISKTTDKRESGFVRFIGGNDSYLKSTASYNTGLSDKGWAFSFLMDHWQAHRKYSEGTAGQGQNYLFSVGYKPNDKHSFNFLVTGAPQWHDQNFSNSEEKFDLYGEKYNSNSGFLNGKRYTERRNFYHKPIANLNWDYSINDKMDLSTVLYASWGRGGGTGMLGKAKAIRNDKGQILFDEIVQNNINNSENGIGDYDDTRIRRASMNNHNWYGLISNLNFDVNKYWNFNLGVDSRMYKGTHYQQLNDLLGLDGFSYNNSVYYTEFSADPWSSLFKIADEKDRFSYDYSEYINYIGGFGQTELTLSNFSVFFQGAISTQSYQRDGRYIADGMDNVGKSAKVDKSGFNVKGGISYTFDDENSIFGNAGYYSRQPYLDNIFKNVRSSNELAGAIENEEITGFEGGYRFKNNNLRLNVDIYYTEWGNRFLAVGDRIVNPNDHTSEINVTNRYSDITQVHKGVEFELEYVPDNRNWSFRTYGSIGNWEYNGSTPFTQQNDDTNEFIISDGSVDLTGSKVGNAPQTSFGAGFNIKLTDQLSVDGDYNIYANLYGAVNAKDVVEASSIGETYQARQLSPYTLGDVGLTYKVNVGKNDIVFRGNVKNVFNTSYIGQADSYGVFMGTGRTYNAGMSYNF